MTKARSNSSGITTLGSTNLTLGSTTTTISGLTLTSPAVNTGYLTSPKEFWTLAASAATGTVQFDISTQGVLYYTTTTSANFTLNFRGTSSTTLNSIMNVGDAWTVSFLTNNTTAYYLSSNPTVDTNATVTIKWSGGTAPSAGNASSVDIYVFTIVKTAASTFTIFGAGPVKYA